VEWEKQSQFKPNTKPIQTQFKPNTNPIQTQYKANSNPIQTQYKPNFKQDVLPGILFVFPGLGSPELSALAAFWSTGFTILNMISQLFNITAIKGRGFASLFNECQ